EAVRLKPDFAFAHCNLGLVLTRQGRFAEGLRHLYRGHELGSCDPDWSYPSRLWVRQCRRLLEMEPNLPSILAGNRHLARPRAALQYADRCLAHKRQYAAAARLYRDAFAASPGPSAATLEQHRYNAACAAALAGCGRGEDVAKLGGSERRALRRQALTWLRADLALWARQFAEG